MARLYATAHLRLVAGATPTSLRRRGHPAQELWESLHDLDAEGLAEPAFLEEIRRRDAELSDGTVRGCTHEEVMESMRRAI